MEKIFGKGGEDRTPITNSKGLRITLIRHPQVQMNNEVYDGSITALFKHPPRHSDTSKEQKQ